MPNTNIIVAGVVRSDPTARGSTVHFDNGQTAELDPGDPRSPAYAQIIDEFRREHLPIYVEIDSAHNVITNLLVPLVVKVTAVVIDASGDADVTLQISHARHRLRSGDPNFNHMIGILRNAQLTGSSVIVTENDNNEIIDVRPSPHPNPAVLRPGPQAPSRDLDHPNFETGDVTAARAKELFNLVNAESCNPKTVPPPCIPFLFPDDGCWGRAHEMCRLMITAGAQPRKVWIYGYLQVYTRNNPHCSVSWGWHVAPTLSVANGKASTEIQVIDPSLFPGPVPQRTWHDVQGDPHARLVPTDAAVFYRYSDGFQTDPTYSETAGVLATFRAKLQLRSLSTAGAPPYAHCRAPVA